MASLLHEPYQTPPPVSDEEEAAKQGSAGATKWVLRATFFILVALAILCAVGPHIPGGG